MVRLRVLEILEEQNHTKYWLFKRMDMTYTAFNKMISNETRSIHYKTLDKMAKILECPVGNLFEQIDDDNKEEYPQ